MSETEKASYFREKVRYKETIPRHFSTLQNSQLVFKINSLIVEKVIGDMFFHPDGHDTVTRTQALKSFTLCLDSDSQYNVIIKNPLQFQLIIAYLTSGLSFRQAENVLSQMKKTH